MENLLSLTEDIRSIPWPMSKWLVPAHVELDEDNGRLMWVVFPELETRPPDKQTPRLLTDFMRLSDASGGEILNYARRWGVLELCYHDFPSSHPPFYWPGYRHTMWPISWMAAMKELAGEPLTILDARRRDAPSPCPIRMDDDDYALIDCSDNDGLKELHAWEPLDAWRTWARRARATLAVARNLHSRYIGSDQDWFTAFGRDGASHQQGFLSDPPHSLEDGWKKLAVVLNFWLKAGDARPGLSLSGQGLSMTLGASSLFEALSIQLLIASSQTYGIAICSDCKDFYLPKRKPNPINRNYCPTCVKRGIPARNRKRDERARKEQP